MMNNYEEKLYENEVLEPIVIYKPKAKARSVWKYAKFAKYRFLVGAVRSSKSFTANDLAIYEIQKLPKCNVLISGYSITSVARNVLAEWKEIIDPYDIGLFRTHKTEKDEYITINWRGLKNKRFYVRGASKESDYKQIQGATFGYWYGDEMTRHHETFTDMAMSRLSLPYSKAVWTANPDHPKHYIKKRFIDDKALYEKDENGYSEFLKWTYYLDDNPSLSNMYIRGLKKLYKGVFYLRYIKSMWVAAEGAIYDFFDRKKHVVSPDEVKTSMVAHRIENYISIDYGTTNPTVFGHFQANRAMEKKKCWLKRMYYYDSKKHQRQKSDGEYVNDLIEFAGDKSIHYTIIIDPSAASFKVEINNAINSGKLNATIKDADNSVIDGIRKQSSMLVSGEYVILDDPSNEMCIENYSAYLWDEKASLRGEDKPIKENDHCLVGDTLVDTITGQKKIKKLVGKSGVAFCYNVDKGESIIGAYRNVRKTRKKQEIWEVELEYGKILSCTGDHQLIRNGEWVEAKNLSSGDSILASYGDRYTNVVGVRKTDRIEDVYCMTVDVYHNFSVNGGIIVKNCKDSERYFLQTVFGGSSYDISLLNTW